MSWRTPCRIQVFRLVENNGVGPEDVDMLVRAVAFPDAPKPGYAVVVDLPVTDQVKQQLRRDTGVQVKDVSAVLDTAHHVRPLDRPPDRGLGRRCRSRQKFRSAWKPGPIIRVPRLDVR